MDGQEIIELFSTFFRNVSYDKIVQAVSKGMEYIVFDFYDVSSYNLALGNILLEDPEETLKAAEAAICQIDIATDIKNIKVRICNLPKSQKIMIRDIRSAQIGKFITVEGIVRQKSDVRPQMTSTRFECPSCGAVIPLLQIENKFRLPPMCGCGRKGKFKLLSKELIDAQSMTFEECIEQLQGGQQPKKIKAFLKDDLVSPITDNKTNPGTKLLVNGYAKEIPIMLKSGGQSTRFDLMVEVNYIEPVEEEFGEVKITPDEEQEIIELAKTHSVCKKLIDSLAPSIYGHEKIKEALLLQMVGGVKKRRDDGSVSRGDMHILLIGDPGAGKSQILKRIDTIAPKSRFISGKGASGAGLTATVVKDEFIGGWALEAGALVLANKGMICLDELDKISKEDTSSMHEALEGQKITISKANIQATLTCETTVLAAANPKFGRFNPYSKTIAEQIELPSTLINRFDMIFPIQDIPEPKKDEKLALFVVEMQQGQKSLQGKIKTEFLRKYIAYCRKKKPEINNEAKQEFVDYYLKMRSRGNGETGLKSIPISARQLEGIIRIAEAYAKIELSDTVKRKHAKKATQMMDYWLRQVAFDGETGTLDIDRIAIGTGTGERKKMSVFRRIIDDLENKLGKHIPMEDILREAEKESITEDEVESIIEKLRKTGDITEAKRGFISKI